MGAVPSQDLQMERYPMNGRRILGIIAIVGLAKMVFAGHRREFADERRERWMSHVAEFHRQLHRRDAEANAGNVEKREPD